MHSFSIRQAELCDAESIRTIYNHYVESTAISFEEEPVSEKEMEARIAKVQSHALPWLVASNADGGRGYAYATKWRERHAYRFTVECTVYVAPQAVGTGVGTALYEQLFPVLRHKGFHAVVAVIALPNAASIALHERFGMEKLAHFKQVGCKFDGWHDVGNWQALL
jgi:L-amino acid N-acyltransferase YncA